MQSLSANPPAAQASNDNCAVQPGPEHTHGRDTSAPVLATETLPAKEEPKKLVDFKGRFKLAQRESLDADTQRVAKRLLHELSLDVWVIEHHLLKVQNGLDQMRLDTQEGENLTLPKILRGLDLKHRLKLPQGGGKHSGDPKIHWEALEAVYPDLLIEYRTLSGKSARAKLVERIQGMEKEGYSLRDALALHQIHPQTYEKWLAAITVEREKAAAWERQRYVPPPALEPRSNYLPSPGRRAKPAAQVAAPAEDPAPGDKKESVYKAEMLMIDLSSVCRDNRILNNLEGLGVTKVNQLLKLPRSALLARSGMGEKSIDQLKQACRRVHPGVGYLFLTCSELGVTGPALEILGLAKIETVWQLLHRTEAEMKRTLGTHFDEVMDTLLPVVRALQPKSGR